MYLFCLRLEDDHAALDAFGAGPDAGILLPGHPSPQHFASSEGARRAVEEALAEVERGGRWDGKSNNRSSSRRSTITASEGDAAEGKRGRDGGGSGGDDVRVVMELRLRSYVVRTGGKSASGGGGVAVKRYSIVGSTCSEG